MDDVICEICPTQFIRTLFVAGRLQFWKILLSVLLFSYSCLSSTSNFHFYSYSTYWINDTLNNTFLRTIALLGNIYRISIETPIPWAIYLCYSKLVATFLYVFSPYHAICLSHFPILINLFLSLSLYLHSNFSTSSSLYNSIFTCVGTVQFLAVGQEIVKSRGFGGLYAGFKFKSLHLGGGGALMAFFLPFFKKIFSVSPSTSDK